MARKTAEARKRDQELTLHHRKPTSIGGSAKDKRNHSYIQHIKHNAWHTLFSNHSAQTIAYMINEKYLDPDYEFILKKK
jgi:hypothetical protein